MSAIEAFRQRLINEWLIPFCSARGYSHEGFDDRNIAKLCEADVRDFLQSIDNHLVCYHDGFFTAPQSKAKQQIFWQGERSSPRRKTTLWVEPVITIGALSRLQNEYCWHANLLGLESKTWAFDLVAYCPEDQNTEYLVCEVKKSPSEIDSLISFMHKHLESASDVDNLLKGAERNAFKKVCALRKSKAEFFWALGPDRYEYVFKVARHNGSVQLNPIEGAALVAPNKVTNNAPSAPDAAEPRRL